MFKIRGISSNAPDHRPAKTRTGQASFSFFLFIFYICWIAMVLVCFSFSVNTRHKAAFLDKDTPSTNHPRHYGRQIRSSIRVLASRIYIHIYIFLGFGLMRYEWTNDFNNEYSTSLMTASHDEKDIIWLDVEPFSSKQENPLSRKWTYSVGKVHGTGFPSLHFFPRSILHCIPKPTDKNRRLSEILLSEAGTGCQSV